MLFGLGAFVFAEISFYLLGAYLENTPSHAHQQAFAGLNYGTLLGITISMLYSRLPHISIITLFYSIGAALIFLALLLCFSFGESCSNNLITAMTHYCIIGGMYLPFVTDSVINIVGGRHRAIGCAMIEFCDTIASFAAPIINIFIRSNASDIIWINGVFLVIATILQRIAERKQPKEKT